MNYKLIRSARKTLGIQVSPEGDIIVRAPRLMPKAEIERLLKTNAAWIEKTKAKVAQRQNAHPEPTEDERREMIRRAKNIIPPLVNYYASLVGVKPTGLTITSARTRFGSCSAKNRLSFSWRLMDYPQEAIEYVVVHELCHIKQHNHSPAFYSEVARVLPDHKERRKLLRQ